MKRFILVLVLILSASGLFSEEILYQKQHKNFDSIDVVALVKSADDWYYISIVIAEDVDAIEKYMIYDTSLESIQDLLFNFEKEKTYKERIKAMEKAETLVFIKEETGIQEGHILRTRHYWYMK
jgi:hypothetical protein